MVVKSGAFGRAVLRVTGVLGGNRLAWKPMARGAAIVLGITSIAQLLSLGLQVLFARLLGPDEFGVYSFVMAGVGLCLILSKLGLDTTLVRLVAEFNAVGDGGRLQGLIRFSRTLGPTLGIVVGVSAFGLITQTGELESPSMYRTLLVGVLVLPVAVYSELTAAALRGLRRVPLAIAGDGIVRPCIAGAGVIALAAYWPEQVTGSSALTMYLAGAVASIALTTAVLRSALPKAVATAGRADLRRYLRIAIPLMFAGGFLVAMYSIDTVMLGLLADTTKAGFYSVATRIAIIVLFVMNAAQMVAAPMLAAAAAGRDPAPLRNVVRTLNALSVAAAVPGSLLLAMLAEPVLGMFGPEFREAAPALRVLAISQLLNVLTGPTGMVLSMTGHERSLALLLLCGLLLNVILNVFWIPAYGLIGAASSAFVAHATWNLAAVFLIKARLGIDITPLDLLRRADSRLG